MNLTSISVSSDPCSSIYWIQEIEKEPLTKTRAKTLKAHVKALENAQAPLLSKLLKIFNKIVNSFTLTQYRFTHYPWSAKKSHFLLLQLENEIEYLQEEIPSNHSLIKTVSLASQILMLKIDKAPLLAASQAALSSDGYTPFPIVEKKGLNPGELSYSYFNANGYCLNNDIEEEEVHESQFCNFAKEEAFHSFLIHDHIIEYFPSFLDGILMQKGVLLSKNSSYCPMKLPTIMHEALKGISYMHSLNLQHGDIKEENLLEIPTDIGDENKIVLIDFGATTFIGEPSKSSDYNYISPEKQKALSAKNPPFTAHLAAKSDDMWAVGIMCINMAGPYKYKSSDLIKKGACNGFIGIHSFYHIPASIAHFVYNALDYNTSCRLSVEEALEHPLLKKACPSYLLDTTSFIETMSQKIQKLIQKVALFGQDIKTCPLNTLLADSMNYTRINLLPDICLHYIKRKAHFLPRYLMHAKMKDKYYLFSYTELEFIYFRQIASCQSYGLSGLNIEFVDNLEPEPLGDLYWDLNSNKVWAEGHKKTYMNLYYPSIIEYLSLNNQIKLENVLELCGGDGQFYGKMKAYKPNLDNYAIIELNKPSLEIAKEQFTHDNALTLFHGDITDESTYVDLKVTLESKGKPSTFDCIIGLGALTHQVLQNKASALKALKCSFSLLNSGGHLILRGLAPSFLNKADLEKEGFLVIETYAFKSQFYVASKP